MWLPPRWDSLSICLALGVLGCGFESGGLGSDNGASVGNVPGSAGKQDGVEDDGGNPSNTGASSSTGTGFMTGGSTGTMAGSSTVQTSGADTWDGTDGGQTSAASTGGTTNGGRETDSGAMDSPYGPCVDEDSCIEDGARCIDYAIGGVSVSRACAPQCMFATDCPTSATGTAEPVCTASHACVIDCGIPFSTCPDGMECYGLLSGAWRCAWPD